MNLIDRKLPHQVTWWASQGPDGFGGDKFALPVLIFGRWEDRQEKFVGQIDKQELVSNAVVFVDRDMSYGDYLAYGDLTATSNPTTLVGPSKIQRYEKISDLRGADWLRRAVL